MFVDLEVALTLSWLDRQSWLFTGVLPNVYAPPKSFCFDDSCADKPVMVCITPFAHQAQPSFSHQKDDPDLEDYNVPKLVKKFIRAAHDEVSLTHEC